MTKTGRVERLLAHTPAPELEIAPGDAARLGVATGDRVRVGSARGAIELSARVTGAVPEGVVAAPMHWSRTFDSEAVVNELTHRALDPVSKQPELKHAAVQVERVPAPSERGLCACRGVSVGAALAAIEGGARSAASVERATGAGGACGSCGPEIAGLLRRAPAAPPKRRLVVVGHGMVAHRFVEVLIEQGGTDRYDVVVLGAEPRPAYDRVHLSELFAGKTPDDLALATVADYAKDGVELRLGVRVAAIDREARAVAVIAGARGGVERASTRTTALSQHCPCGARVEKRLADRTHDCPHCQLRGDRDEVAAVLASFVIIERPGDPSSARVDADAATRALPQIRHALAHPVVLGWQDTRSESNDLSAREESLSWGTSTPDSVAVARRIVGMAPYPTLNETGFGWTTSDRARMRTNLPRWYGLPYLRDSS
jgi:bacterioferritin-associated ferredoxin/formylmethanofuran dehydrogenase subunit D